MPDRTPPMIVCPYCGPEHIMYAGRVIAIPCKQCRALLKSAWDDNDGVYATKRDMYKNAYGMSDNRFHSLTNI